MQVQLIRAPSPTYDRILACLDVQLQRVRAVYHAKMTLRQLLTATASSFGSVFLESSTHEVLRKGDEYLIKGSSSTQLVTTS